MLEIHTIESIHKFLKINLPILYATVVGAIDERLRKADELVNPFERLVRLRSPRFRDDRGCRLQFLGAGGKGWLQFETLVRQGKV